MKKFYVLAGLITASLSFAQSTPSGRVGINNSDPKATLDITQSSNADTNEGVLIPRLTKARVQAILSTNRVDGTLVYVEDAVTQPTDAATFTGEGRGFYYWDSSEKGGTNRWVKVGGGGGGAQTLQTTKANVKIDALPLLVSEWANDDYLIVLTSGTGSVDLPDPAANPNRVIAVSNLSGASRNYGTNAPFNVSTIGSNRSMMLISNGTAWYLAAGL